MSNDVIFKLPNFDAILLLSVHHQLIKKYGDDWTKEFVYNLAEKSKLVFIIEFAALNKKYADEGSSLFYDNDEISVYNYACEWLKNSLPGWDYKYIGKAPESKREPYRYLFACIKSGNN